MQRFLIFFLLLISPYCAWGAEFDHKEKHYSLRYDDQSFTLVHPGQLGTDVIVYHKQAEEGFYPNLTIASHPTPADFQFTAAVSNTRYQYQTILPNVQFVQDSPFIWKGYDGHLFEVSYTREKHELYLRSLLVQTPHLVMSMNITAPIRTKDGHLATFMAILDTLEIHPWPNTPSESSSSTASPPM